MDTTISPHIISRRQRKTAMLVAALLATICLTAWGINRAVSPSVDADSVSIATVRVGNIANSISASGADARGQGTRQAWPAGAGR